MKRISAFILIFVLFSNIIGCNAFDAVPSNETTYNKFSETSYEYYEDGYWCDIYNVFCEDGFFYAVVGAIPIDTDDTNLVNHYSVNKINDSGELICQYQIENINPYVMSDVYDGVLYYVTFDSKLVKFDLDSGTTIDSVQLNDLLCGTACFDDGYVILRDGQVDKYDYDNNLISSVINDEWGLYSGMGTFYSVNNNYYLVSSDGSDYRYYEVNFENSSSEFLLTTGGMGKKVKCCYKQYLIDDSGELCLDFEEDTLSTLLYWNMMDMQPQKCGLSNNPSYIVFDNNNFAKIYTYEDGTSQLLFYSYLSTENYTRQEIKIGGYDLYDDPSLNWAVYEFNTSQDEYRAVIEDYADIFGYSDNPTQTDAAMIEYFVNGNSPDIFYGNWFDYKSLYESGLTQSITPYIKDDFEESFLGITDNIRSLMINNNGECYRLFSSYQLEGYIGSATLFDNDSDLSISELIQTSEQKNILPVDYALASNLVYSAIAYSVSSMEELSEEDIISILNYAYEYGYQNLDACSSISLNEDSVNEIGLWNYGVYNPAVYANNEKQCNSELMYVGFPAVNGSVHLVLPQGQVGLSSSTLYPEQCCELMSYLLKDNVQLFNVVNCQIPVKQSILQYYCDASVNHSIMENRNIYNYLELDEEISSESKDRFLQAVYSADAVLMYDWDMNAIIEEEVNSYYLENLSVETIAASLKNRLDLYIDENNN